MKIPQHILESINCGEVSASKYFATYGKENIEAELKKLKIDDEKFFIKYPKFYQTKKETKKESKKVFGNVKIVQKISAYAAIFIFALVIVFTPKHSFVNESVREKGDATQFFVYRKNGENAELLHSNDFVKAGDELQLAFNSTGSGYILIFSVDGDGNVTKQYPEDNFSAVKMPVEKGTTFLGYSYELDNAPEYELFVMVTSNEPFTLDETVLKKLSLRKLQKGNYLPKNTEISSILLKK